MITKTLEPFLEASEADNGQHEIKIEEAQTDREAGSDFTLCACAANLRGCF